MGAQVTLCGPATLLPMELLQLSPAGALRNGGWEETLGELASVRTDTNLDRAIEGADVVMALRLQTERQSGGFLPSLREYVRRWQVTEARMARAKPGALLMHPGPMNEGIEVSASLAHGGSSAIQQQVANGVAVRMALLYQLAIGQHKPDGPG
jgi:aspartate carbamoyltransferase catalytic subunit